MHPENLTRSIRRFGKAYGIPKMGPHKLRHTFCTMLFDADVDLKTVQYLMGHSDPQTTLSIYAHYLDSKGVKAMSAVNKMVDSLPATNIIRLEKAKGGWGIRAEAV